MLVDCFPDRILKVNSKEYLYFGGTSYLAMATNPEFQEILNKNLKKWGTFYGSSRSANIQLVVYDEVEKMFSEQFGSEKALTVSSGTLAGKLVIDYLAHSSPSFYHYPKTHPAVLGPNSKPLFEDDKLQRTLLNDTADKVVISVDTILGLEVTPTSFDFLEQISPAKKITLVLDESHSLGILGKSGMGIFNEISHQRIQRKILTSSLGKAIGLAGGIIASDAEFIEDLQKEADFVSSSGASPAYLQTYIDAQEIYTRQRKKLALNLAFISQHLTKNKHLKFDKNYPVIYSKSERIFTTLLEHNIVITSFKYPTYKKPMNRMVITANHTQNDLEKLITIVNNDK